MNSLFPSPSYSTSGNKDWKDQSGICSLLSLWFSKKKKGFVSFFSDSRNWVSLCSSWYLWTLCNPVSDSRVLLISLPLMHPKREKMKDGDFYGNRKSCTSKDLNLIRRHRSFKKQDLLLGSIAETAQYRLGSFLHTVFTFLGGSQRENWLISRSSEEK